jgi:hypothetical protein
MTLTLGFGWWLLPTAVTIISFVVALYKGQDEESHGDYASIGNAMVAIVVYGAAIIVSLLAWLIWAVLT